ncbi:hypothetical protein [Rhodococcus qingshengii]|uniref:hypothetical protein n=1 Tax=Rhodococcus qingshengii TaxID=334542 RepID=UPI001C5D2712|nr:hypothetical protein [Rhodococcus qingshengii]MBW4818786.1 hypothetical protein [Rhodococcus qingshengii]
MSRQHDHGACDSESAGYTTDKVRLGALVTDGVHRLGEHEGPFSIHAIGIGKAGANIVEEMIRQHAGGGVASSGATRFSGLAIDIGDDELAGATGPGPPGRSASPLCGGTRVT